jgi:hypothetical protein
MMGQTSNLFWSILISSADWPVRLGEFDGKQTIRRIGLTQRAVSNLGHLWHCGGDTLGRRPRGRLRDMRA